MTNQAEHLAQKRRYRVPTQTHSVEVSLDEFSDDEIREYMKQKGGVAIEFAPGDLAHIETLALCGQRDAARELALNIVSELIGRPL